MPNATDLLREDHRKVKDLFREFEEAEDAEEKGRIAAQVFMDLEIHTQVEEEVFYPAIRKQDKEHMTEIMNEADEEHHVVDLLIAEMKKMRPGDPKFAAKFTVMAENVKHHIQEEETEIFTKAAEAGMDSLRSLGDKMEARKMELTAAYGRRKPQAKPAPRKRATTASRNGASGTRATARKNGRTAAGSGAMKKTARKTVRKAGAAVKKAGRKATAARNGASGSARKKAKSASRSR